MRLRSVVLRVIAAVLALGLGYLLLAPTGRYLLRGAWEEGHILARRVSIANLVADPATPPDTRGKLELVLAARAFAHDSLALATKESFTQYSAFPRDTLVLVLSGAYRDRLELVTWWFPIVGRVPYKGFFDFAAAKEAARRLGADGYDVYLRPSPAFSTLGFFNDPLLPTSLKTDSADLATTVVHELTHNTFYASGQAVFNESFANFAGSRGAARFFRSRGDSASAKAVEDRWADDTLFARFWERVYHSIDSVYTAHPESAPARIAAHDSVYLRAREILVRELGPKLRTIDARVLPRVRLDNATLMARRIYLTELDLFDGVYAREDNDPRRAIARVIELARSRPRDPYAAVRDWLAGRGGRN